MAGALVTGMLLAAVLATGSAHARGARSAASCANAGKSVRRLSLGAARAAVVCLINLERTDRGLPALSVSNRLNTSAETWTLEMVRSGQFGHGSDFSGRITAAGYQWEVAGENIATGQRTPRGVVRAWMASLTHCQTMLNPVFRNVGTGESPHPVPGLTQRPATWTQDFGLAQGSRPPSRYAAPAAACPYH